ncbi:uncharacterized protein LOC114848361 [Betta splendens]|uniref:Uncharacterized protein LOC114848361 n=1 Tax=Betta splendens TaxID=158456 RepID=A0A6P7LJX2_BETSP|nr:uncharacterized protein LOC114848361 [Betta splendens]
MASWLFFGFVVLLLGWSTAKCSSVPDGVVHMECHDRYFVIAVDSSFTGGEPHFDAVDETGIYPITPRYAAKCGYTMVPLSDHVELRASYFSCHTDNQDDTLFTFNFNMIVTHEEKEVAYELNSTCSPSLSWSPREVTCELNYMEVSVRSEVSCPSGTMKDDWNALKTAYSSTTSDWQVMFHRAEEQLQPMSLSEARKQDYVFEVTGGRLVFRTPYGQRNSVLTEVNDVPVEMVHATLFSRQSWVVLMVDMVAACSKFNGSSDDAGHVVWKTPEALYASLDTTQLNIGLGGERVSQPVATERGYVLEMHNGIIQISIPTSSEGGRRKSFVRDNLYEFYTFDFYLEQILEDEDRVETRLWSHRMLTTPLLPLPLPVVAENQTDPEKRAFSVYLGDLPEDVELMAVQINGHELTMPTSNTSTYTITRVVHPNSTHGYSLKVPFNDPVVIYEFSKEDAVYRCELGLNFTLIVLPEKKSFYHFETIVTFLTDISPPVFDAFCSDSGISFKLDHQPLDYLWEISVGSDPLTSDLAARHGYVMSNDSQSLQLHAPLFTPGYRYKNITLKGFLGTFEILVQNRITSELQSSTVKTCSFNTTGELIVCSTDGRMVVVANLSQAVPSGGIPARTSLRNRNCGPKDADDTMALFSFPLNVCGSSIKIGKGNVTYQNEISYNKKYVDNNDSVVAEAPQRVIVQCTYHLAGLHRLFSAFRFESDTAGAGAIVRTARTDADVQSSTTTTAAVQTTPAAYGPRIPRMLLRAFPPRQNLGHSRVQLNMI